MRGAWCRFLLTLAGLLLLALATGSGTLWGIAGGMVLLAATSAGLSRVGANRLKFAVTLPTTAGKGTAVAGEIRIVSRWWLPVRLVGKLMVTNDLTGEITPIPLDADIPPRGSCRLTFLLESGHCGRLYVETRELRVVDWFGIFPLPIPGRAGARCTVLPELFPCQVTLSPAPAPAEDSSLTRRGQDPTEIFQLREYQPGDDVRRIHWKLSSKLGKPIFREPSQNVDRALLVYWDKRFPGTPAQTDALAEMVSSLCRGLCQEGLSFDLGWTEGDRPAFRPIDGEDALLQALPALVTRCGTPGCPEPELTAYGQVLYLTARLPERTDDPAFRFFLCADGAAAGDNVVVCTPETCEKTLERLVL